MAESTTSRIQRLFTDGEILTANEVMGRVPCQRPQIHYALDQLERRGWIISREALGNGPEITYSARRPEKTLAQRIERIERILEHHQLGTFLLDP